MHDLSKSKRIEPIHPSNSKNYKKSTLTIKAWAEEDRPREKLLSKGRRHLSNAELIAILLGSGSREETAVSLAKRVLQSVENDLDRLGKQSIAELMKFKGIGEAKAISIAAATELGRRRQSTDIKEKPVIKSSKDAADILAPMLMDLPHEEFWVLFLNNSNRVIGKEQLSSGGTNKTIVDTKIVFRKAIESLASAVIFFHNHPSGNRKPSQADLDLTKKLSAGGKLLEISVLDHLIIAGNDYYSFADEGLM